MIDDMGHTPNYHSYSSFLAYLSTSCYGAGPAHYSRRQQLFITQIHVHYSNTVSDIDASTNKVISSIPIYGIHPTGLGYDPANNNIYVANLDSKSFSVIDTSTNFVIPNIPVNGIAMRIWRPNNEINGTVSIIDAKNTVVGSITVGIDPYAMAYDSANKNIYVANFLSNTVSVINSLTNTVIATIPVGVNPSGVAYDSANGNIYVSNVSPNNVSVIDGSNNTVIDTIQVGTSPYGIAYNPANQNIYVANLGSNNVSVIHP